jgi:dihydrodipicolinate synthase/N-acetylneuraminate lyase
MKSSERNEPAEGVYAALATPRRTSHVEPDTAAFLDYLDTVVRAGANGIVLFGSTGEFIHFDVADRMHVLNLAIRRSRVPVLVNVSHSTLDGALALADDAIDCGAAGLLLLPPYFYRYAEQDIEEFYIRFADDLGRRVPIYLYNLPLFTNGICAGLAERLLGTGQFAGIKDSSGDWDLFERLLRLRRERSFQLLAGNERIYLQSRQQGANGVVSGVAAALPELIVAIDRALRQNNEERARMLNEQLQHFLDCVDRFPGTVGIKQAAVARGWNLEHVAVPLGPISTAELEAFRSWLREWIPSILRECARA